MLDAFFVFFGIGCVLGLAYVMVRYGVPMLLWGLWQLVQALGELYQAGREGWKRGAEKNRLVIK